MKKIIIILVMFLVLTNIVYAENTFIACIDDQTAQYNTTIFNSTDMTILISTTQNIKCTQNCSTTLNNCRDDEPYQMYYFLIIIVASFIILVFALWVGRRIVMMDFPIYAIMAMFFAFMGGYFDVFNSYYNTIFLAMVFVSIGFFLYSLWQNIGLRKSKKEEKRATGRV